MKLTDLVVGAHLKTIETDLRSKSGHQSIRFDKNGFLTYDKNDAAIEGAERMRRALLGAIEDENSIFEIIDCSGSKNIQFAKTDQGTIDTIPRITTYQVLIDFTGFYRSRKLTPPEVLTSYTIGITLFHEINHKVSYDPNDPIPSSGVRPDLGSRCVRGVIENTNTVRRELSLSLRNPKSHRDNLI